VLPLDWRRTAGWAAVVAPLLMWSEFLSMGTLRHGYNLLTRPYSDLGTRGTPHADIFALGFFFLPGLLTIVVGVGLWFAIKTSRAWSSGALLVVATGAFQVAVGIFPQDPGSVVEGRVRKLTDFGAFVEIEEGIDGLVHISDLSWTKRVKHPSEVLKKGQLVQAVDILRDDLHIEILFKFCKDGMCLVG